MTATAGRPQEAVHAGGDDRQPPCGDFYFIKGPIISAISLAHAVLPGSTLNSIGLVSQ